MIGELVHLYPYECRHAMIVGAERWCEALRKGVEKNHYSDKSWQDHMEGGGAETAVGNFLNRYWWGSVDTFHRREEPPDVGQDIEVRWARVKENTAPEKYSLIVRPDDILERYFILVLGFMPDYYIIGGMRGTKAKRDDWLKNPGGENGERKPAWFVPQKFLKPASEFPRDRKETEHEVSRL